MKRLLLPITLSATLLVSFAFTGSEPCSTNDYFTKGTITKTGYYKADGTQTGTGTCTVTDILTSGDSTIAVMTNDYVDAKNDKSNHSGTMRFACINGAIIMDLSGMMNGAAMPSKDMKMVMKGNFIPYKTSYTAGEKLDDIHMTMDMYNNGSLMATSNIDITNRVCEAVEDHVTAAGTFHCFKISSVNNVSTHMGAMTIPSHASKSIEWFSPKVGMVRNEAYKDDKLFTYSELLSSVKP